MRTKRERLIWARKRAGYQHASDAARAFGWVESTYLSHENGSRGFTNTTAERYSKALGVRPVWLIHGEGTPDGRPRKSKVVGYVGGGAEIIPIDDHAQGAGMDEVDAPPGLSEDEESLVVIVRGESMWPAYRDGDAIHYTAIHHDVSGLVGKECIVKLADGRMFLKILDRGSTPSTYTLTSYNAPAMPNAPIEWAAPVRWVERRQ